jgi:UDP-N-acetyl-2-amino-2-deoxyglucuronate dehydrogenase
MNSCDRSGKPVREMRFAIIGTGNIAKLHADEICKISGARLVAVAGSDKKKARDFARQYNIDWCGDYREMLKREDIDIVNICTPSGMHGEMVREAAKSKKNVLVEKPMEICLHLADEMINVCHEEGVKLSVIFQHRFDPSIKRIKKEMEAGKFGTLFLAEVSINWFRSQAYYDSGEWRGTWALDGGGALMNQSIHTIDLLQHLMGPIESVFALSGTFAHERIEVEDVAVATVKFKNGALGTIVGTTAAYPGLPARLEIFGTRGSAVVEDDRLTHLYFKDEEFQEVRKNHADQLELNHSTGSADPMAIGGSTHQEQFRDFIAAIHEGRDPKIDGKEGRKSLEIILAIYKSAKEGQQVSLPLS